MKEYSMVHEIFNYCCFSEIRKRNPMQAGVNQPQQMAPRPQIQSPQMNNGGGQFHPRMPHNQFQGTPQFRGIYKIRSFCILPIPVHTGIF